MKIYHNPRCRKSRETLAIIGEKGIEPEIIEYLKEPPSVSELTIILMQLGMQAEEIIRKEESLYKEKYKGKDLTNDQWIKIMVDNPILIQRPIVVEGNSAIMGRPPENVKELL